MIVLIAYCELLLILRLIYYVYRGAIITWAAIAFN